MIRMHRLCVTTAVALALAAGFASPAQAAAPANDGPRTARAATGIGYTDSLNVSQATSGRLDPTSCSNNASVWYKYTPATVETINVNTNGSNYDTVIGVFTGRPGAFAKVACRNDRFALGAGLDLKVQAGRTYYFMVAACCGNGRDGQDFQRRLLLQFHLMAPLRVEQLAVAGTGTVDRADGDAHVTLSRRCNHLASESWMEGELQQRVGDTFVAHGFLFRQATCGTSSSDISLRFQPQGDVAFGEGPATVSLRLTACSEETGTCSRRRVSSDVVLAYP